MVALGINLERIEPGHPQQNGLHKRSRVMLRKEATTPASYNFLQQQRRFDDMLKGCKGRTRSRVAEREGFEPPDPCGSTVFKTAAFDRSATSPASAFSASRTSPRNRLVPLALEP